ncbi:hypothetical protein PENTCL1PPCAC_9425, partial [Pristionchus entomophagus]
QMRRILILLYSCISASCYFIPHCMNNADTISWASGKESTTRAINFTACSFAYKSFTVLRPLNSTKAIRVTIVGQDEDNDSSVQIRVFESAVGDDGKERDFMRKDLNGIDDSVLSSPFTSLSVHVSKRGKPAKTELILRFTLEDGGCPFPFLEARQGVPLVITSEILANECDFSVTTMDPGTALELSSIHDSLPHQRHSIAVVVYDGFTGERLHR